jgi:hypothetical protein
VYPLKGTEGSNPSLSAISSSLLQLLSSHPAVDLALESLSKKPFHAPGMPL